MNTVQTIIQIVMSIIWTTLAIWALLIYKHNEKREKRIKVRMKVKATKRATESWKGLCEMYLGQIAQRDAEIKRLNEVIAAKDKEIALWEKIGKTVKLRKNNDYHA